MKFVVSAISKSPRMSSHSTSTRSTNASFQQALVQWTVVGACVLGLASVVVLVVLFVRRARSRRAEEAEQDVPVVPSRPEKQASKRRQGSESGGSKVRKSVIVAPAPPSSDSHVWGEEEILSSRAQRAGILQKSSASPRAASVVSASPRSPGRGAATPVPPEATTSGDAVTSQSA